MTLVIGVDPHKQTHTAVAVRSVSGELVDERTAAAWPSGYPELLAWAQAAGEDRVWAFEDVRAVSRGLERFLLERGEGVVRVPPKLMAGARKSARAFGKSDSIEALAIAGAATSHSDLPSAASRTTTDGDKVTPGDATGTRSSTHIAVGAVAGAYRFTHSVGSRGLPNRGWPLVLSFIEITQARALSNCALRR